MHQTAKSRQWYFGMKAHLGVDSRTKLIHTALVSAANVADALALPHLLHGKEARVWGEQAHRGQKDAMRAVAPQARDFTNQRYRRVAGSTNASRRPTATSRGSVPRLPTQSV
jgi:IS5 family transposase